LGFDRIALGIGNTHGHGGRAVNPLPYAEKPPANVKNTKPRSSFMFRLKPTPILCFVEFTRSFNRTMFRLERPAKRMKNERASCSVRLRNGGDFGGVWLPGRRSRQGRQRYNGEAHGFGSSPRLTPGAASGAPTTERARANSKTHAQIRRVGRAEFFHSRPQACTGYACESC
jgi:hypothetical protein